LLFSTSSMFELHVVVAGIVMFNILELIMEIVPTFPTRPASSLQRMVAHSHRHYELLRHRFLVLINHQYLHTWQSNYMCFLLEEDLSC
jgi:hypothetical protein